MMRCMRRGGCRHASMLQGSLASSAPLVLGALSEKHPPNHGPLWEMLLTYCRALPGAWDHVDFAKLVLPRLTAFLRCQIRTLQVCCRSRLERAASPPPVLRYQTCLPLMIQLSCH